jgi:hypothetical protein
VFEKFQHAEGRAGRKNRTADNKSTDIIEMKAIDIFVGRYGGTGSNGGYVAALSLNPAS